MRTTTRVYSFKRLVEAQQMFDALVAAGFDTARVRLRSISDEAAPVEGNFAIGNGRTVGENDPPGALAGREGPYETNIQRQVDRGTQLVEIEATDEEAQKARAIAVAHHGIDVADRTKPR